MKHLFYTLFFLFCAATTVTAQTVSQVRSQSTDPTYTPTGAVTSPPLCYNRTTHHLWGYAGGYWYDLTGGTYIDLDPSPTNEKIVSFSVVAGVLRINENGIFYNVPINDIIAAANISSASPTITVTNTAGVISITSADPDESVTNELQNLNLAGQTLSISSGNNVALPVVGVTAGVGISTSTAAGVTTVTNTSPDQTVILNGGGATTVTGTYPNFTVTTPLSLDNDPTNECNTSITVNSGNLEITDPCSTQSVAVTNIAPVQAIAAGTGISTSVAGGTVTITNTDPDQTVTVTGAGINTVTGTYPNFTVTATEVDGSTTNEVQTITQGYGTIVTPTGIDYTVECDTTQVATQYDLTQLSTTDWKLTGNAGTNAGTNFVGTTDAQDLVLKTNGVEIARFGQQGNAAFGSDFTSLDPSLIPPTANNIGSMAFQSGQATGLYSTAFHLAAASGEASMAWGASEGSFSSTASGGASTAWGASTTASGEASTAFGRGNVASGRLSVSFGDANTAPSYAETTLGTNATNYIPISSTNFNAADRLFTIGNGTSGAARNNALTLWKDGRSMWNGDVAKQNTWIGVNGTNAQNFINVTTPAGNLAAISTEHTPSGNYAVLGSNAGNSGLVINDGGQFAFTITAGTTSTQLGATTTIANYCKTGVVIGGGTVATSTLDVVGSFSLPVLIVNSTTTITSTNCSIECNNGATNITLTLPAPTTCRGRIYMVHRNAGSTGTVTINPGGGQIQELAGTLGATTTISALGSYGQHVWFQSDGTNWLRIN